MKVVVPDLISNSYFPAPAAVELGFFEAEGLDMSYELIFPVDDANKAMRDGKVDFVAGSAHSTLAAFPGWNGAKLVWADLVASERETQRSRSSAPRSSRKRGQYSSAKSSFTSLVNAAGR